MKTQITKSTQSFWNSDRKPQNFSALRDDLKFDVCIVGGGIAGLMTAYQLQKEGKHICILESSEVGAGQTGVTTAHCTLVLDKRFYEFEKIFGAEKTRLIANSHHSALQEIEKIIRDEEIKCDFAKVNGYLFCEPEDSPEEIFAEHKAAQNAGLAHVQILPHAPFESYDTGACLAFPDQVQIHPMKFLMALTEILLGRGVKIYNSTHVVSTDEFESGDIKVNTKDGFFIRCKHLVVATNSPINNLVAIHTKQAPYRSYVLGFRIQRGTFPKSLFWDTKDPYHYIRTTSLDEESDLLIVGGEDHKTGQAENPELRFDQIEHWTRARFADVGEILYHWSGQIMESVDGLAFLGRNPSGNKNTYIITGDSGNGFTNSTIGAMIITDQIIGRPNAWEKLYDPGRITFQTLNTYIKENLNVTAQYTDWMLLGAKQELEDLMVEEGVVLGRGLEKIAVYKNAGGHLESCSAVCPHLGGIVRWNSAEKSWDCPCHGSRFTPQGEVIEGPATENLGPVNEAHRAEIKSHEVKVDSKSTLY